MTKALVFATHMSHWRATKIAKGENTCLSRPGRVVPRLACTCNRESDVYINRTRRRLYSRCYTFSCIQFQQGKNILYTQEFDAQKTNNGVHYRLWLHFSNGQCVCVTYDDNSQRLSHKRHRACRAPRLTHRRRSNASLREREGARHHSLLISFASRRTSKLVVAPPPFALCRLGRVY